MGIYIYREYFIFNFYEIFWKPLFKKKKFSENSIIVNETWDFWAPHLTKSIVIKPELDVSSVY